MRSLVHVLSVVNIEHNNVVQVAPDNVEDSIIARPNSINLLLSNIYALDEFVPKRKRFFRQHFNFLDNLLPKFQCDRPQSSSAMLLSNNPNKSVARSLPPTVKGSTTAGMRACSASHCDARESS